MKYRKLDENGDYVFGHGDANFWKDQPEAPAQACFTRLLLIQGEWFLDTSAGTPYNSKILGAGTMNSYDLAIQEVILDTPGITGITGYASGVDPKTRLAKVVADIESLYGPASLQANL